MNKTKVTILGSGTCVPSLSRSACSVLIESGHARLLLDTGPGTMRRLLETGTTIFDVSVIFYSHLHPDHTAELVPFLFATKYPGSHSRQKPLTIVAGKGFSHFFKGLTSVYGEWIMLGDDIFKIVELDTTGSDSLDIEGFSIASAPVEHCEESLAYRITGPDKKSIVYSGDTDFSKNLVSLSKGADLLICESAMPDSMKVPGHLTPSLAGEIATRAGVKKLVLTHFYPECDKSDIANECSRTYSGEIILAEDLMEIV
ncbi:MAG: ribonuclease Z [Deltaproteobacteria bacterium]|nr:ribonuclease Z [Deltaproteobacteria bacterium]MBW2218925.1 ribonuclease Z [Deltaproteobacteria bacterium]